MLSHSAIRSVLGGVSILLLGAAAGCATTGHAAQVPQALTDRDGMTLYRFDKDKPGSGASACHDGCSAAWPPVPADNETGKGFGSFMRSDGRRQLTYHGWPAYYYSGDDKPGDMKGDDFAGTWHVIRRERTGASND